MFYFSIKQVNHEKNIKEKCQTFAILEKADSFWPLAIPYKTNATYEQPNIGSHYRAIVNRTNT